MEFCPKCGAMMFPSDGILRCNTCGYADELEDAKNFYSWFKQQDTRRIIESYKNILPEKIYKALYDYNFSY